jgi:hypothetical protein
MTGLSEARDIEEFMPMLIAAGFPTFDEFKRNPEKYRLGRFQLFESVQNSDLADRDSLAKQKMYWKHGTQALNFGQILRIAAEEGYQPEDLEVIPFRDRNASGTGKDVIYVRFFSKIEVKLMGGIVPNG